MRKRNREWKRTSGSSPLLAFTGLEDKLLLSEGKNEHSGNKQFWCRSLTNFPMKKWLGVSVQGHVRSGCWHQTSPPKRGKALGHLCCSGKSLGSVVISCSRVGCIWPNSKQLQALLGVLWIQSPQAASQAGANRCWSAGMRYTEEHGHSFFIAEIHSVRAWLQGEECLPFPHLSVS